jgi:hypothetical protein
MTTYLVTQYLGLDQHRSIDKDVVAAIPNIEPQPAQRFTIKISPLAKTHFLLDMNEALY